MKKTLTLCATAALVAMALTGCEKTGTIEGEVCDAFTGKPLEMPTIWMDSTIYSTLKEKYKYKQELRKGQFKFEKVPVGNYKILAGRSKYIKSKNMISTTEENPNLKVTTARQQAGTVYKHDLQIPMKNDKTLAERAVDALQGHDFHCVYTHADGTRDMSYALPNSSTIDLDEQLSANSSVLLKVKVLSMSHPVTLTTA